MGYFQVRYDSRVVIYDCRAFIRLATGTVVCKIGYSYTYGECYLPLVPGIEGNGYQS